MTSQRKRGWAVTAKAAQATQTGEHGGRRTVPEHRLIRRRVGWALIALGVLTLAYMIAGHYLGWPVITGVNLLALAAGGALLLGQLSTARAMTWCLAVWLTVGIGISVLVPLIQPIEVTAAMLRHQTRSTLVTLAYQIALMGFSFWAYRALRRPAVIEAMQARGVRVAPPWVAVGLGLVVVVGLAVAEFRLSHSGAAATARAQARLMHGLERTYDVQRLTGGIDGGRASLVAYGPGGTETVAVVWGERALGLEACVMVVRAPGCPGL